MREPIDIGDAQAEFEDAWLQEDAGSGRGWRPIIAIRGLLGANDLLRHNVLLIIGTFFTGIVSYLFHPAVTHLLGGGAYGAIISLMSLMGILALPSQVFITVFNKFTADLTARGQNDQLSYLLRGATRYSIWFGILNAVVIIALSPLIATFLKLQSPALVVVVGLGMVLSLAGAVTNGAVQGRQKFGWLALMSFVAIALRVALTVALIIALEPFGWGIYGAILGIVLSNLAGYALSLWVLRDVFSAPKVPLPSLTPLFAYSLTATLAGVGGNLISNVDTILAKHFLTPMDAGYYAAIVTIGRIVLFVSASGGSVMFPKITAMNQKGEAQGAILGWTMLGVFALSASVVLVFWLFPGQLIALLFHAPPQVARELVVFGVAMLLSALAGILQSYFLSLGRISFVPILLGSCALQALVITIWHGGISQIVNGMLAVMAFQLVGFSALYAWQDWGIGKKTRAYLSGVAS
jgi:O-antigen/teichoic acid export membrane protein